MQAAAEVVPLFMRGLAIGFFIAAPVGPIGLLCIQRTLAQGRAVGFASGLGAASADAFYGFIAAFGLTMVSSFLVKQSAWLGVVGGLFLCYLGVRAFLAPPARQTTEGAHLNLRSAYVSTLLLTLTNPMTIFAFIGIFAAARLTGESGGVMEASALVVGVFLGSAAWWLLLSGGVSLLRKRLTAGVMVWINRIAGAVIIGFGVYALAGAWFA